jgi:L-amino acid N-acyltransferase YncA
MTIRLARESDLPTIVNIYNASIPHKMATADLTPVSVDSRRDWFLAHKPKKHPIFVKVRDNSVIAWLSFQPFYGRPAYHATAEVSIYVAPDYQHQGMGQELLGYGIGKSPELGLKTLLGFIFAHNRASVNLFEKFGFQCWGYLPNVAELDGVERDLLILGKRL